MMLVLAQPLFGVVTLVLGVCLGIWLGRYLAARPFRQEYLEFSASETLGSLLTKDERATYASAYHDPASAAQQMDQITYAVPNVLTPFVTCGPRPGQSGNAFINSMQFRSCREVTMPKPAHTYRIFLTGGSTAFGSGAPSQEATVGAVLERKLNGDIAKEGNLEIEVFTLANPAWASTHERILIENRLSELSPDLVISLSGNNDAHWAAEERDVLWLRTYADQHMWNLLNLGRNLAGLPAMPEVTEHPVKLTPEQVADRLEKNIRLSSLALSLAGAEYLFVLQPMIALSTKTLSTREKEIRGEAHAPGSNHFRECYRQFKACLSVMSSEGLSYLDLSDLFASYKATDEIFLDSYHFGDRGYEVIGLALAEAITSMRQKRV